MAAEEQYPISARFLRYRGRDRISAEEMAALEAAFDPPRVAPARKTLIAKQDRVTASTILVEGIMCRYLDDRQGYRQLLGIHVPGDFVDLHGYPLMKLDHDVAALTEVKVASVPRERMDRLTERFPNLTRTLWYSTMLDAAMHREWIFRLGRLGAAGRVAHFFSEAEARLRLAGFGDEHSAPLPINQTDVAEACGLTPVHVNRVLRQLREEGLMTFRSGVLTIGDRARLYRLAEFDKTYLYLSENAPN